MIIRRRALLPLIFLLWFVGKASGQQVLVNDAKKKALNDLSLQNQNRYLLNHQKALDLAKIYGWPVVRKTKQGGLVLLQGIDSKGRPVYLMTFDNVIAAATTQTNAIQPGGDLGLTLSGSNTFLKDKIAIWDGGEVYKAHQEFAGKTITLEDLVSYIDHATHVAGTMMAKGVYAPAKGMAFNATTLHSYYFDNDVSKMSKAALGLLLSNHSYGDEAGWNFDDIQNRWEWFGLPGDTVDYSFGFYGTRTQQWDQIAYNAPYYLIVESAGNARGYPGPAVGQDYYGYASSSNLTIVNKGPRPANISSNNAYETVSTTGNAKNILTVGAINPVPYGPVGGEQISTAFFSSWGPTNDGRIKPDIVGDGVNVTSCGSASPDNYITLSGTSMSAPNVTGSLYLLQEYYAEKHNGNVMRAATLKGLACHTALDAGNTGPDYIYGWGVLDMKAAALAIKNNGAKSLIEEDTLQQGQTQTFKVIASGDGPLMATISWTDPPGTPTPDGTVESPTPKLVNDLDVRISDGTNTYYPWVLNPSKPSARATTGDNVLDNIEQVLIPGTVPGKSYTITVTHKGALNGGSQEYSLIATGIGGTAYCVSAPLSSADSRINNFTLSGINNSPPPGCTTYSDYTGMTAQLIQGMTYPLSITLGTCGNNFNKAAKVYIDWNNNGVFESNELAATTNIINGTGTYTTNITVPATVIPKTYSRLRIVLEETSDTSAIKPCGAYAKGETQDYRVLFDQTGSDAGITAINLPAGSGACPGPSQIAVTIKNFGDTSISNIPVTVTVEGPGQTTTLNQTYTATLAPNEQEQFILNGTVNLAAGDTYTVTAGTNLGGDPISSNNETSTTATVSTSPTASDLLAYYCVNNKNYQLSGAGDGELLWYQNPTDSIPFAFGSGAVTSLPPVNNTYYAGLNDFGGTIGPQTKYAFGGGGYNQFTPFVNVSTRIPIVIKSARLYIGNSGKITFNVASTNGEVVSSTTIDAVATRSVPGPGAQADDPGDQGAVYPLNLLLPRPGAYTVSAVYDSTATLYRSNVGVNGYPFTKGGVFSIDGNDATSAADTAYYKGFYYYFYNMQLQSAGCASASKQAVITTKPVIAQNGTILNSSFPSGNQWYLDGKAITGATGASFTPTKSGNYTLGVTVGGGCQALSDNLVFVMTAGAGNNSEIGLVVYPVPASGPLNILFAAPASTTLNLSLIDAAGLRVYAAEQAITAGNVSTAIDVSRLAPGSYVLKLLLGQKAYYDKIVVMR